VAKGLGKKDAVVIDGDLLPRVSVEKEYLSALKGDTDTGVIVCSISKTSDILASDGNSAASLMERLAPQGAWYYHPVVSAEGVEVAYVKLHPRSNYCFKFEAFVGIDMAEIKTVLSALAENSKDPVFIGYPYGLVEADSFARVSNKEKDFLKAVLMARSGKDWSMIESLSRASDAHDVLDRIKF